MNGYPVIFINCVALVGWLVGWLVDSTHAHVSHHTYFASCPCARSVRRSIALSFLFLLTPQRTAQRAGSTTTQHGASATSVVRHRPQAPVPVEPLNATKVRRVMCSTKSNTNQASVVVVAGASSPLVRLPPWQQQQRSMPLSRYIYVASVVRR